MGWWSAEAYGAMPPSVLCAHRYELASGTQPFAVSLTCANGSASDSLNAWVVSPRMRIKSIIRDRPFYPRLEFNYLGGNKLLCNPDRQDRGVEHADIVDVLDGMICRGHMTEGDAEDLLEEVMEFEYDFMGISSCNNAPQPCN